MSGINKVILVGNLGKDPEVRHLEGGAVVAKFPLATSETYKTKDGQEKEVTVGQVTVLVNVAYFFKEPEKTIVPAAIQNVANGLAGKKVETLPILLAAGVFLITLIIVASFIYSMIHSSIISVGRNPMSQAAIYRDLLQMSSLVLTILAAGMVSIYLILTKL